MAQKVKVLECLYSPMVEKVTPLGEELLALRQQFLSQMIFQTFNGYAMSQFKKIGQDIRNHGEVRWKHAMHLLRLLLTGAATLRNASVPVRVEAHRDRSRPGRNQTARTPRLRSGEPLPHQSAAKHGQRS